MKKNKLFNVAIAGVVMLTSSLTFAQGQTEPCYGAVARDYVVGTKKGSAELVDLNRRDFTKAQGMPQNDNTENFVSLGYGGSIIIDFNGAVMDHAGNDITIIETSYASNDCNSDGIERANVEVSMDGVTYISVGQVCRNGSIDIADSGLAYVTSIKISNDDSSTTFDGYDVDGVIAIAGCVEVPTRLTCVAIDVYDYEQGTRMNGQPITDPIRIDPSKALAVENDRSNGADNFFSLGNNGWIILKMGGNIITDGTPAADLRVYETTWGDRSCASYPEYAEVSVSSDAIMWYSLGTVCQSSNISLDVDGAIPGGLKVSYVKIANNATLGLTNDYFDVDGVEALFGCSTDDTPPTRGGCFASCVAENSYVPGTKKNGTPISPLRVDATKALGAPENDNTINFVTLGYGGSIVLCFDGIVLNQDGDDLQIVETSFGSPSCESYKEYADVDVSIDGLTWYPVGTVCLDSTIDISNAPIALPYIQYVRIANNNELSQTEDGYDVDGVIVLNGDCQPAIVGTPSTQIVSTSQAISNNVVAWPNPAKTDLNFTFNVVETGEATLELYNTNGQLVSKLFGGQAIENQDNVVRFDASKLANGLYISRLTTQDGTITGKVMIAH